jgi:hypothetical protein
MLSREEYIFTIGYDGPAAVVDNQAKKKYGSLSTRELAEKGLFRAAFAAAVYSKDPEDLNLVAETYNKTAGGGAQPVTPASLDRLFGVFPVDVKRSIVL